MICKVYVITHKECFYKTPDNYIPVQVGKVNTGLELPYLKDETGDSISSKNSNYCELTAWYWLWKNVELPDYIGLCHYRRFFVKKDSLFRGGSTLITSEYVEHIMRDYDIILPKKINLGMTVKEFYYKHGEGRKNDIDEIENIIAEKYPEYTDAMDEVFNSIESSYWNLAVMKKEHFMEYCQWLFDILFELENRIDISDYTAAEARIYGYLSEILINIWVAKKRLKVHRDSMIFVDEKKWKNLLRRIRAGYLLK